MSGIESFISFAQADTCCSSDIESYYYDMMHHFDSMSECPCMLEVRTGARTKRRRSVAKTGNK